jgi:hypothetical protein
MDDPDFDVPPPPPPPITSLGDVVAGLSLAPKKDQLTKTAGPQKASLQFELGAAQLKDTKASLNKAPPPPLKSGTPEQDELKNMIQGGMARLRKVGNRRNSMGEAKGLATNAPVKYPMPTKSSTGGLIGITEPNSKAAVTLPTTVRCAGCKQIIEDGTEAMEIGTESSVPRMYHPMCFKCTRCRLPIEEGGYSFVAVGAAHEEFHDKCLGCDTCHCALILTAYTAFPTDGYYYCREHVPRPMCVKCDSKIMGKCVEVGGLKFHRECFLCASCRDPIAGPYFPEPSGATCQKCYEGSKASQCTKCKKTLSGQVLSVTDDMGVSHSLHSHCFTCLTCSADLNGEKVGSHRGQFYCVTHWREEKKKG